MLGGLVPIGIGRHVGKAMWVSSWVIIQSDASSEAVVCSPMRRRVKPGQPCMSPHVVP